MFFKPFPNQVLVLTCLQNTKNAMGKGEIAHNKQFVIFSQCFFTLSFSKELTLYHTIPTFNDPGKEAF